MKLLNTRMFVLLLTLVVVWLIGAGTTMAEDDVKIIPYDYIDEHGILKGGMTEVDSEDPYDTAIGGPEKGLRDSVYDVNTIIYNGDPNNRIDLVILGDGYDINDINNGLYAADVNNIIEGFFAELPLNEYASFFNVYRVEVDSNESGIGSQPKDTALKMWYDGRILKIDVSLAKEAADNVPYWDQTLALANSIQYGGRGYWDDDIATVAGANEWSPEIALHEFGHTFGQLDDEYFDANGITYTGMDDSLLRANLSIYDANDMNDRKTKWYRWLEFEVNEPNVWTFKGGMRDYNEGIYRPTEWSMMRRVDYPFYQVNAEQLIFKIYELVKPIDYATPEGTYPVGTESNLFFVEPVQPATHSLDVQWYLDGNSIPGATGTTIDASALHMSPGEHTLDVNVVDNTELVKDANERERLMTDFRTWTLMKRALVGYWKLDEISGTIAADSSIYDNNGLLNNMDPNTDWVAGKINGALDFDGENDYVSLSPIAVLEGNNVTIAAWIKADSLSAGDHSILVQYDPPNGYYFLVRNYKPALYLNDQLAQSSEPIDTNDWYHLSGTYDGFDLKIYVDGVEKGTEALVGETGLNNNAYIGWLFAGIIDDVRVYNFALDANEVWELSYESEADFNGDDIVNFLDYALFANAWQTTLGDPDYNDICDLADNNSIDYNDLAFFTDDWLWQAGGAMMMAQNMGQGMSQGFGLMERLYQAAPAKQQPTQIKPLDIEELIKWLEELWLTDEELRKMISEDEWKKFIESVSESM